MQQNEGVSISWECWQKINRLSLISLFLCYLEHYIYFVQSPFTARILYTPLSGLRPSKQRRIQSSVHNITHSFYCVETDENTRGCNKGILKGSRWKPFCSSPDPRCLHVSAFCLRSRWFLETISTLRQIFVSFFNSKPYGSFCKSVRHLHNCHVACNPSFHPVPTVQLSVWISTVWYKWNQQVLIRDRPKCLFFLSWI